jgi:crotonobetainyl-CoA:carnitine CoA-transferase CaiB-like acyl-CoA transferase
MTAALAKYRICDFTGQLAGAGATKWLAAFGAEVIRIEDPVRQGRWDILRGMEPYKDDRRGIDLGGAFNNHNTGKYGITLNLRTDKARAILAELVRQSDVVTENFAAGVLDSWGFGYDGLRALKPDIIYVSNCGFGHEGPYSRFKTWGPIVQAVSGLTHTSALPGQPPAGWGYSYMDHTGGYYMAMAILLALIHRERTGAGQWVDLACTEAALTLHGPALLDWTVNGRGTRDDPARSSNRSPWRPMAPHGIYAAAGDDEWVAIACRSDAEWQRLCELMGDETCRRADWATVAGRVADQDALDACITDWTTTRDKFECAALLRALGIPASAVQRPAERVDQDPATRAFGLWPTVLHSAIGAVRVDGLPVHLSDTDWSITRGGPCLGEHNVEVLGRLLGYTPETVAALTAEGVL